MANETEGERETVEKICFDIFIYFILSAAFLSTGIHDPPTTRQRVSAVHGKNL